MSNVTVTCHVFHWFTGRGDGDTYPPAYISWLMVGHVWKKVVSLHRAGHACNWNEFHQHAGVHQLAEAELAQSLQKF